MYISPPQSAVHHICPPYFRSPFSDLVATLEPWECADGSGTPDTYPRHAAIRGCNAIPMTEDFPDTHKSRRKRIVERIRKTRVKILKSGNKLPQNIKRADTSTNLLSEHKIKRLSSTIIEPEDIIEAEFAVIRVGSWGDECRRWTYT